MDETEAKSRVQLGCWVKLELIDRSGARERLEFDLVPEAQADYPAGFLGVATPLAQAILGETTGVMIPYFTEELMAVEILAIRASSRQSAENAAAQRGATVEAARDQIEFTNAVLFAASTDTKWGKYDADGLDYEGWKAKQVKDEDSQKANNAE